MKQDAKVSRIREHIEKLAMDPAQVKELIDNHMQGDIEYPDLKAIEAVTSDDFAELYKQMSEEVKTEPTKYEKHSRMTGMTPDELAVLFGEVHGLFEKYPEIWKSQENARLLSPKNLMILVDIFRKDK